MKFTSTSLFRVLTVFSTISISTAFILAPPLQPKQFHLPTHLPVQVDVGVAEDLERSTWLKTFALLDEDNSGFLDKQELKAGLVALGQPSSDNDILNFLREEGIELTEDLSIDQETFLSIVGAGSNNELDATNIRQMYHAIDIDASGYITTAELQHFMGNLGMFIDDGNMSGLMGLYDADGNGRITFDEFQDIVIDLGFNVRIDTDSSKGIDGPDQNDGLYFDSVEGVAQLEKDSGEHAPVTEGSIHTSKTKEDPEEEQEPKFVALASIADKDLRNALAPFDMDGEGTIDLVKVRDAAEGKIPPKLHWSENRPMVGLAEHVTQVNHLAILVSDISRSLKFYSQVVGFEQIRRPNFDAHGAWLTMGNIELHLIKGRPIVPKGDDLVVGHISIDADNVLGVLDKLIKMNVPFRKNSSVPSGADAGSMNTNANDDMMSDKIITQYFIRDPDGYYVEICNCDETLTQYCLGEKETLPGYEEGVQPLSFATASTTINLLQRWMAKLEADNVNVKKLADKIKQKTDGSIKQVAEVAKCIRANRVDQTALQTLKDRHSIYGDVWQNEEIEDIEEILIAAGNDPKTAETVVKLRIEFRGKRIYRPPVVFNKDGSKYVPTPIETDLVGNSLGDSSAATLPRS